MLSAQFLNLSSLAIIDNDMRETSLILPLAGEAGCDEAGRGCLCGPVVAAAVILPEGFSIPNLDDSKKLSARMREQLRVLIEQEALAWGVGMVDAEEIDEINILNASILAMHRALDKLTVRPTNILVDGNRFKAYQDIPHRTEVKGDGRFTSIAAASILAKTHRDELMLNLSKRFPGYDWEHNMGYPSKKHLAALSQLGLTPYHRRSYGPCKALLDDNAEC
jgi:ribonuclease HII